MERALIYAPCKILAFLPCTLFIKISKGTLWEIILNGRWFCTLGWEKKKKAISEEFPAINPEK